MQRSHFGDLAAHLIGQGGWQILTIPAEWEGGQKRATSIGWTDPRTEPGQLICEQRFGPLQVAEAKLRGSYHWAAQYQQRPSPAGGSILKKAWFRFYRELPKLDQMILSMDASFKGASDSDYVVLQCWGKAGADRYLVDEFRKQMDFPATLQAFRKMCAKWPAAAVKIVEVKANGQAIVDSLSHEISGIIGYSPTESKEARVNAVSGQIESGNVFVPDPASCRWVDAFIEEVCSFPYAAFDDRVDCMTQALIRLGVLEPKLFRRDLIEACLTQGPQKPTPAHEEAPVLDPVLFHHTFGKWEKRL
jgi:predicted phage terminase large subunit-like protein